MMVLQKILKTNIVPECEKTVRKIIVADSD